MPGAVPGPRDAGADMETAGAADVEVVGGVAAGVDGVALAAAVGVRDQVVVTAGGALGPELDRQRGAADVERRGGGHVDAAAGEGDRLIGIGYDRARGAQRVGAAIGAAEQVRPRACA